MQIIKLKIDELKPYKNNAKIHTDEQIQQIKDSITKFGNNDPLAIWGNENLIVEGHGRYTALKELGYTEVECIRLDHLSEAERKAYALAHNKLTMNTGWDNELLSIELESLQDIDFDLDLTGFEEIEIEGLLNAAEYYEPINDEALEKTAVLEYKLKCGKIEIVLTAEEYETLFEAYTSYVNENGVSFGFVGGLLNG